MTEVTCKMDDGIEVILSDSDRIGDIYENPEILGDDSE